MNSKSFELKVVSTTIQMSHTGLSHKINQTPEEKKKWHTLLRATGNNFQFGESQDHEWFM